MRSFFVLLALVLIIDRSVHAQDVMRRPLPEGHPVIGQWRTDLPQYNCFEEYVVRANGTRSVVAGQERNESEFTISPRPSPGGFYKWVDKIVKNNGKPDCLGGTTPVGHVAVNYIRFHPSGDRFLLCGQEDLNTCYAEFRRK